MYLLDTNVCIALINKDPVKTRTQFQNAAKAGEPMYISSITSFELWYGVRKSDREDFNRGRLEIFLSGRVQLLPFDEEDAKRAGFVRSTLEAKGKMIGPFDTLLAGQALRHGLIVATANVREFSRVESLKVENWVR
jgi:tRNA(fMet)-specific endonuclease VapC